MTKMFAYYRISPNNRKNNPIENQIREIRKYAKENNIEIIAEFRDNLQSGKSLNRPRFNQMMMNINQVDGIIIYDVSRFSRNAKEAIPVFMSILNSNKLITLVKNNITLDNTDDNLNIWELLIPIVEFFQAEEFLNNLHLKQKLGIQRYIEKNGHWGRKKQEVNWKRYDFYRKKGVPKSAIANLLEIGRTTLYRRLNERMVHKST